MKFSKNKIALATLFALSLSACSPNKTVDEYIVDAKASINNNQEKNAIIELKNAIRSDLKNPEARFLLGSIYLKQGNAAEAEKELKKALSLKFNIEKVLPKLIKALNLQDKSKEVLSIIDEHSLIAQKSPEILLYQAIAYNRLGKKQEAKQAIEQANDLSAQSVYSQLGEAYLKIESSDAEDALVLIDKILDKSQNFTDAILLKGQLNGYLKNYPEAIKSFEQYFKLTPNDIKIRFFLADAYVKNEQFKEANSQLDYLLKIAPEQSFINQLKGLVYYQQNNFKQALFHTQKAIQNGLNTNSNRVIAGLSAFKLKQYELAHQLLVTVVKDLPKSHPVRKVLAMVQLQLGYGDEASDTLADIENLTSEDVNLITSASFELLKEGKTEQAKVLLNKTDKIESDNSQDKIKIGILKLSMNDLEGITDLEKAIEIDPELPLAKMALAAAYIQNKEYDKALALAEKWKNDNPKAVEGYNLAAKVLLLQNKKVEAEKEFAKTLSINPTDNYALLYFIEQNINAKKYNEAKDKLNRLLNKSPNNLIALIQNYRVATLLGNSKDAIAKIKALFDKNKENINIRLIYAKTLFAERSFKDIVALLTEDKVTKNTPPLYWALLGRSYIALAEYEKAVEIYDQWITNDSNETNAWVGKVASLERSGDILGALTTVELWLRKQPENQTAIMLYPYYLILNDKTNEATVQINKFTSEQKNTDYVKSLYARIAYKNGDFKAALPGFITLYKIQPSSENVNLIYNTLMQQHKNSEALAFLKDHVDKQPNDYYSKALLAQLAVTKDNKLAQKNYQDLLTQYPNNIQYLNNLAWLLYQNKDYDNSFNLISKAMKLQPKNANVLDTAAAIEQGRGNIEEAKKLIQKAKLLAPNDLEIKQHYLKIMKH